MRFGLCFADHNAYSYISLFIAMVVIFADTGMAAYRSILHADLIARRSYAHVYCLFLSSNTYM